MILILTHLNINKKEKNMKNISLREEKLIKEFVEILLEEKSKEYEFIKNDVKAFLQFTLLVIGLLILMNPAAEIIISAEFIIASTIAFLDLISFEYNNKKNGYEYSPELFDALLNLGGLGLLKFLNLLKQKNMTEKMVFYPERGIEIHESFEKFYNSITRVIMSGIMLYDLIDSTAMIKNLKAEVIKKYPELKNDSETNQIFQEYSNILSNVSNDKKITVQEIENIQTLKNDLLTISNTFEIKEKVEQKMPEIKQGIVQKIISTKPKNKDESWDWPDWIKDIFKPMKYKMKKKK